MKWYKAKIRENIGTNFCGIEHIERYGGQYVYLRDGNEVLDYKYRGRLPKNNIGYRFGWDENCFSEIEEIT